MVAVENPAPANSKSLVSNPVVGSAMMVDTTQELVPNQERDQRKMMQAQAKQMVANQVNQGVVNQGVVNQVKQVPKCQTNQINQANVEVANKEGVN